MPRAASRVRPTSKACVRSRPGWPAPSGRRSLYDDIAKEPGSRSPEPRLAGHVPHVFVRRHMGFRTLRVINEDRVAPAQGFGAHGHEDMEILTYVLSGELAHKDSMGNIETLRAGELQRISAGSGIVHSEFNGSKTDPV